ncbi:Fructose-bisphosphate aldolase class Ia, DhnA family [Thermomonospora echinospora]|uniref:Fructose-bisphosphate aldolase class Ia, DhnA family n=1 Tax=Thermomonospora echinospora TaxID=1992 RepID=A0A1H6E1S0_9ACTN|nr:aldolase [Thermomonospora echinospora]SEG91522.1 Fructose-bisphosphate aldolase class Ia, DhnA family [Thermomonospora echinospora]
MVAARLDRMFSAGGRCFDVAIDHGMVNEASFLNGIEDMAATVRIVAEAQPDVIQLTPGMVKHLHGVPGRRPALALRSDVSNVYGRELPRHTFSQLIDGIVEMAVVSDAVCVVVNLLQLPDQPELHHQCVRNIAALKRDCERAGMPLMIEPLVMAPNEKGGYMVDGDLVKITALVRQAAELGADIIKADPCTDPAEFHQVVEVASEVPVLVRGGGRETDEVVLERTAEIMRQGAAGIVYGRNVIHHRHPRRIIRALMALVHDPSTPLDTARAILAGDEPLPNGTHPHEAGLITR